MQNLLFGITLEKRIYLHIQNLVILHSIASEYSFTFKSTLFKNPARSDIIAKRLCKNTEDIGVVKHILAGLFNCTRSQTFSPERFCYIIPHFRSPRMDVIFAKHTNASHYFMISSDSKSKTLFLSAFSISLI